MKQKKIPWLDTFFFIYFVLFFFFFTVETFSKQCLMHLVFSFWELGYVSDASDCIRHLQDGTIWRVSQPKHSRHLQAWDCSLILISKACSPTSAALEMEVNDSCMKSNPSSRRASTTLPSVPSSICLCIYSLFVFRKSWQFLFSVTTCSVFSQPVQVHQTVPPPPLIG